MLSTYFKRAAAQHKFRAPAACQRLITTTTTEFKPNTTVADNATSGLEYAVPFEEMPRPTRFDFIRGFFPGGMFYKKSMNNFLEILQGQYGNIFIVPSLFGRPDIVVSMNPSDYQLIFRNEGPLPVRRAFDTVVYYREQHRPEIFQGIEGVLATSGEKWKAVRSAVNPVLMQPKNARLYLNIMQEVSDEFLARIRDIADPVTHEMPADFSEDINRLALETVCAVALNKQLGMVRKNRDSAESKTIIDSVHRFFDLTFELELLPPYWKYVKTPKFHEMMRVLDTLTNACIKYINEAFVRIEHDAEGKLTSAVGMEKSVLEKLLRIDKRIAVAMALDMMMAGVDTTSSALTGILLCIAKNPDKQAKLLEEVKTILPNKDSRLTVESLKSMPYLRACIKEAIRLYPLVPGTMRRMPHDVVLSGYRIPAGTDVTMGSNLQMSDEKFVPRAKEFLPERWLRSDDNKELEGAITNPFMYLPFGFGVRSCVGKRLVELELEIAVSRLVRNFNIEFNHSIENAFQMKFLNVPVIPLKFKFEERTN